MLNAPKHDKTKRTWGPLAQTHCGSAPSSFPPTLLSPSLQGIQSEVGVQNILHAFPEMTPSTDLAQFVSRPGDKKM